MSTVDSAGRSAYMYNAEDDTWYALSGLVNTNVEYDWTASQIFGATVTFEAVLNAQGGVNNFADETVRDLVIPSPSNGIVCFVRSLGQLQYYWNGTWMWFGDSMVLSGISSNYTIALSDPGKTLIANSISDITITVPPNSDAAFKVGQRLDIVRQGSGNVTIEQGTGVTVNSKNGNKKISARYSGASLFKVDTNSWILIGDLTA